MGDLPKCNMVMHQLVFLVVSLMSTVEKVSCVNVSFGNFYQLTKDFGNEYSNAHDSFFSCNYNENCDRVLASGNLDPDSSTSDMETRTNQHDNINTWSKMPAIPTNIAIGKKAVDDYRNATELHIPASYAIDGNKNTDFYGNSCTHSYPSGGKLPWWRVDFEGTGVVYSVDVTNRGDCCGHRLSDFNIRVGWNPEGRGDKNQLCQRNAGVEKGKTKTFNCHPALYGRYLYVQSNLNEFFTLCEVEVFGLSDA